MKNIILSSSLVLLLTGFAASNVSTVSAQSTDKTETCFTLTSDLAIGAQDKITNGNVYKLQFYLNRAGYLTVQPTGYLGNLTFQAVKKYQKDNGINSTGYVGPLTRAKLAKSSCQFIADGFSENATNPSVCPTGKSCITDNSVRVIPMKSQKSVNRFATIGEQNQVLGAFDIAVTGEPVVVDQMRMAVGVNTSNGKVLFSQFSLVDENGNVLVGPEQIIVTGSIISFVKTITLPLGTHTYYVKGYIPSEGYNNGDSMTMSTNPVGLWFNTHSQSGKMLTFPASGYNIDLGTTIFQGGSNPKSDFTISATTDKSDYSLQDPIVLTMTVKNNNTSSATLDLSNTCSIAFSLIDETAGKDISYGQDNCIRSSASVVFAAGDSKIFMKTIAPGTFPIMRGNSYDMLVMVLDWKNEHTSRTSMFHIQ